MWLTIDIGNSSIKAGLFDRTGLLDTFRLAAEPFPTADKLQQKLRLFLKDQTICQTGVASVVPALTPVIEEAAQTVTGVPAKQLSVKSPAPITLDYQTPQTLGIDRFIAAVAGYQTYGGSQPVVVVDAGTAITHEVVNKKGTYLGGMISPGPALLRESLTEKTAQLSHIPLELPTQPIGRSTAQAMQAGIMTTCIGGIQESVKRLAQELNQPPVVVLTGGWSNLLSPHLSNIDHVDPHLVLKGIYLLLSYKP